MRRRNSAGGASGNWSQTDYYCKVMIDTAALITMGILHCLEMMILKKAVRFLHSSLLHSSSHPTHPAPNDGGWSKLEIICRVDLHLIQ